jgi:SAM-dependent methyltransferase
MTYANAWLKWFDIIEAGAIPLTERMMALSGVGGTDKVLDIGTGVGEPALSIAEKLDTAGHVLAVDIDPNMIALARDRARSRGALNVDFLIADIETLDLTPRSIDTAFARWSLMFVTDLAGVLSTLSEVLRPGGKLVAATWASPDLVPALSLAKSAVIDHFNLPPTTFGHADAFALSDAEATKAALIKAGYRNVTVEQFTVVYEFDSPTSYIQYRLDVDGPLWEGVGIKSPQASLEARVAIEKAMEPYRTSGGTYQLLNQAFCFVGNV